MPADEAGSVPMIECLATHYTIGTLKEGVGFGSRASATCLWR